MRGLSNCIYFTVYIYIFRFVFQMESILDLLKMFSDEKKASYVEIFRLNEVTPENILGKRKQHLLLQIDPEDLGMIVLQCIKGKNVIPIFYFL